MAGRSVRLQMLPATEQHLEKVAEDYHCFYGDKPSISKLLAKIAEGELKIQSESALRKKYPKGGLKEIKFTTFLNLKGITAIISKKISECGGNIFKVDVQPREHLGVLTFVIEIGDSEAKKLIEKLQDITIEDIEKDNQEEDGSYSEEILHTIGTAIGLDYANYKSKAKDRESLRETTYEFIKIINKERLLRSISCSLGLKIRVDNSVGVLAKISEIITNKKILISSIKLGFDPDFGEAIIDIFLEFNIESNSKKDNLGSRKIEDAIKEIKDLEEVKETQRLAEEFLIK
jgi:uncharacterized protein with ACT and thioredoxin-like domain